MKVCFGSSVLWRVFCRGTEVLGEACFWFCSEKRDLKLVSVWFHFCSASLSSQRHQKGDFVKWNHTDTRLGYQFLRRDILFGNPPRSDRTANNYR